MPWRGGAARRAGAGGGGRLRHPPCAGRTKLQGWLQPQPARAWRCSGRWSAGGTGCSPASCAACTRSCAWWTAQLGFVGGINIIDDRNDLNHGVGDAPRLDFAVRAAGAGGRARRADRAGDVDARRLRARLARRAVAMARSTEPLANARVRLLLSQLRILPPATGLLAADNRRRPPRACRLPGARQPAPAPRHRAQPTSRPSAMHAGARRSGLPLFLPRPPVPPRAGQGGAARREGAPAAARQGRLPGLAGLAARACSTTSCSPQGCAASTSTQPAFLHAKVAVVDGDWATVGSSNIDPLSLLLNLEANIVMPRRGRSPPKFEPWHSKQALRAITPDHRGALPEARAARRAGARLRGLAGALVPAHGGRVGALLAACSRRPARPTARPWRALGADHWSQRAAVHAGLSANDRMWLAARRERS